MSSTATPRNNFFDGWKILLVTALLGLAGWGGVTIVNHGERISKNEQQATDIQRDVADIKATLNRIEGLLLQERASGRN